MSSGGTGRFRFLDDVLKSQYTRDYPPKNAFAERRIPGSGPLDGMRLHTATTYRSDFSPKRGRSQSARPPDVAIPAHELDDATTYRTDFSPKRAQLESPPKLPYPSWTAPFQGRSTYGADFVQREVRPWTAEPVLEGPRVPLDSSTEYTDQYRRRPMPPRDLRASAPLLPSKHVPVVTTYARDYAPKPLEARERFTCCDEPNHPATQGSMARTTVSFAPRTPTQPSVQRARW
ncbi:hypothetical protein GPECTOR_11g81 [Gonium pectorale]|uniref:Uncharacterized protein n=1 Tax=Gonium pectorale TaxID=33097 RepID=A0A150GQD6_GONPE|nr:hypothetical protein GPECTOR_11g81 [Gonium pectorale]|eukprot:KXZ51958.1 hypothetical protein GPECTOR_11g81 [Gonium pectorale]